MNARMEWLSAIYQDMTGTLPLKEFWETPVGRGIAENIPAFLYDQPTCNLDEIVQQLPEQSRQEVYHLVRKHNMESCAQLLNSGLLPRGKENDDYSLFNAVLIRSSLRTPPPRKRRNAHLRRAAEAVR